MDWEGCGVGRPKGSSRNVNKCSQSTVAVWRKQVKAGPSSLQSDSYSWDAVPPSFLSSLESSTMLIGSKSTKGYLYTEHCWTGLSCGGREEEGRCILARTGRHHVPLQDRGILSPLWGSWKSSNTTVSSPPGTRFRHKDPEEGLEVTPAFLPSSPGYITIWRIIAIQAGVYTPTIWGLLREENGTPKVGGEVWFSASLSFQGLWSPDQPMEWACNLRAHDPTQCFSPGKGWALFLVCFSLVDIAWFKPRIKNHPGRQQRERPVWPQRWSYSWKTITRIWN